MPHDAVETARPYAHAPRENWQAGSRTPSPAGIIRRYVVRAHIVMAYVVMAYVVMACSWGP